MKGKEKWRHCGLFSGFTTRNPDTSTTCSTEGRPSVDVRHCFQANYFTYTGADKYIFEALALGQVAQQNLLALPSNLLALL